MADQGRAGDEMEIEHPNSSLTPATIAAHNIADGTRTEAELGQAVEFGENRGEGEDQEEEEEDDDDLFQLPENEDEFETFGDPYDSLNDEPLMFDSSDSSDIGAAELAEFERALLKSSTPGQPTRARRKVKKKKKGKEKSNGKTVKGAKRKRSGPKKQALNPEIQALLGEANHYYVNQEFDRAAAVLQEVIRRDPKVYQAWNTLALIREEEGHYDQSLKLLMVGAHLTPQDAGNWKRVGLLTLQYADRERGIVEGAAEGSQRDAASERYAKAKEEAMYCLTKAVRADPTDVEAWSDRITLAIDAGDFKGAAEGYKAVVRIAPHNLDVIREATPIFVHQLDDPNTPVE
ncbi:transcription factor TFIIIC subunit tfc4, partial [Spiromyces aspiralis]